MYLYSYLIANLTIFIIWLLLFALRKDVRKPMLFMSVLFGIGGLFVEYVYTEDWWRPLTVTNTRIGIEDFLFGFCIAGIATVIYEELFKKKIYPRKLRKDRPLSFIFFLSLTLLIIFYISFYYFKLNSFYASLVAFVPLILLIWIKRKDLILDSIVTGLLISLVGFIWFWVPEFFTPGWVKNYWLFENLSGIMILKAPLEDLLWGFIAGAYIGPLYEFWQGSRLVPYKPVNKRRR